MNNEIFTYSKQKRTRMSLLFVISFFILIPYLNAQECESKMTIKLKNSKGGFYAGQTITFTNKADGKVFTQKSDVNGEAKFVLPCSSDFEISISNYSRRKEMQTLPDDGSEGMRTFTYEPDMIEKEKAFAMTGDEQKTVDAEAAALPDTIFIKGSEMSPPSNKNNYTSLSLLLKDIEGNALQNEVVKFIGKKRGKSIKGATDKNGKLSVYLPKGDDYSLNFIYNKDFSKMDVPYSKGTSNTSLSLSYLGTKEIERRKKEEAERIAAEEKRLKEEKALFEKWCKEKRISLEEGFRRKAEAYGKDDQRDAEGRVVSAVFDRNKWPEKLIVCDLTGSMQPYASELALWYKLNCTKEKNLQFVFFNDGDEKPDHLKKIGSTGGIYYSPASNYDALVKLMAKVSAAGSGGDCPENNMEALLKATELAAPYKELVMIVDNDAPVKDISLLSKFNKPVHIILCGCYDGNVLTDYLNIALKTKGTIHTIEEDITKIAGMMEGQEIKIGNTVYKIMGGEFVRISKV